MFDLLIKIAITQIYTNISNLFRLQTLQCQVMKRVNIMSTKVVLAKLAPTRFTTKAKL